MATPLRATILLTLLLAGPALALPGDAPIAALAPSDGQVVAASKSPVVVSFTCPLFTKREASGIFSAEKGSALDYSAAFGTAPTVGPDGRLVDRTAIGRVNERAATLEVCDAGLGSGGFPKPQATPGTYYWQAWRDCPGCSTGFEVGPVVAFVIRASGTATLRVQRRAYVGYPFVATASYSASGSTGSQLQRKVGEKWHAIAKFVGDGEPILTLPKGVQTLRTVVKVGGETVTSAPATVAVVAATRFSTGARDDGTYRDPKRPSVRFSVVGSGRTIVGFTADVPTLCGSATTNTGLAPNVGQVTLPPLRIAPDGRFAVTATTKRLTVRLVGRLVLGRLKETRAGISTTNCGGSITVDARRVRT
jgi:hypothetical protein